MKLKKLAVIMSCSTLALAVSSCSSSKTDADTAKIQDLNTPAQTITANTKAVDTKAVDTKAPSMTTQAQVEVVKPKLAMSTNTSYTVGYQVGSGIAKQNFGLNDDQTIAGFKDAISDTKSKISDANIEKNMNSLKDKMIKQQLDVATENKIKSKEFMAQVAKMDNAIKVNDQAYYQMVKQGNGKKPSAGSTVTIAYKGTTPVIAYNADKSKLNDVKAAKMIGPSFDSSDNATFPLTNLIQCWKDAIPEIPVGSTIILYCAPDAAYGARAPASIRPNQALAFEITVKNFK